MPPPSGEFALYETTIQVEGNDGNINFTNLSIAQQLADTNSFSFIWRTEQREANFSTHVDFYRANLGKEVTVAISDVFTFKGFISSISCTDYSATATEYQILGKGLFAKLDEVEECNSFYHKTLSDIFNALNTTQNTTLHLSPTNTSALFYHVQYNATAFSFYKMLATRYGEWLYYDGEEMVLAAPSGDAVELENQTDIQNLHVNAAIRKTIIPGVGYDQYSGEVLRNTPSSSDSSGMVGASVDAADSTFGSNHSGRRISTAPTADLLREMNTLMQQAATASTVFVEGITRNPSVKLGGKIRIVDRDGNSEGEYIVIQLYHTASQGSNYQNQFVAIPADVQVPPYTNPLIYPVCAAQQATVVDNEDADGLDRIKVRFPWMQDTETTPWISVMVPYAGNGRGMRFIPEVDEEVMIDFVDHNAERPIMIGSFYTTANTSGVSHDGNNIKAFGTRSGRRLEIDDDNGSLRIYDNFTNEVPKNGILMKRKDDETNIIIESQKNASNYTIISLDKDENLNLGVVVGDELKAEIRLEKDGPNILIHSKGNININADGDINVNAGGDLKMKASGKAEIEGTQGVKIKGMEIKGEADTNLELKGLNTKMEGSVQTEVKGGALAKIQAALIQIN